MNSFKNAPPSAGSRWRRWLPFGAMLGLVVFAVIAAGLRRARWLFDIIERVPGSDKVGHFFLLGGLAFALNWALGGRRVKLGPLALQLGGLLVAGAITVEEFSQLWIPARAFDWADLAANYAGIACAGWLTRRFLP